MPRSANKIGFRELRVGIFTLIALTVLVFLLLNASGDFNPFERRFQLKAHFASAEGLREGANVQLAGMPIGKVEGVRLLPPGTANDAKVEATFTVSETVDGEPVFQRIRTDSTAQLVASTVLGNDKVIDITPGTSTGQPVPENFVLKTVVPATINQLTVSGNELVQQLNRLAIPMTDIATKINEGEGTLGRVINDEQLYENLNATIAQSRRTVSELQSVAASLNRGEGTAGRLLNDPEIYNSINRSTAQLEAIARDLRAGRGTAGRLLRDEALYNDLRATVAETRASVSRLTQIAERFEPIIADLNEGRGTAGKFLKDEALYNEARDTLARFNSTALRVEGIVSAAERGEGTLGKFIRDESLYNNINQATSEANKLIYDFRQNPRKYLTVKFELF
ncbi:MAG: MlaD family protein [Acidobacteriota bacterium]|nr:MlaD family protein [Acidobacteriota bacterium]